MFVKATEFSMYANMSSESNGDFSLNLQLSDFKADVWRMKSLGEIKGEDAIFKHSLMVLWGTNIGGDISGFDSHSESLDQIF